MINLSKMSHFQSRSISAENFTGEKGKGGMATEGLGKKNAEELGTGWKISPAVELKPGEVFEIANIKESGIIKHIWMTDSCPENRKLVIRMYWDGSEIPSVEAPLGDFFASAECQEYAQISSLAVCVNPKRGFNCYWDMPFYSQARITVENLHNENVYLFYQVDYVVGKLEEGYGYFHAQYRRCEKLPYKEVYTILDNVKGNGHYVGTYLFCRVSGKGWWGEGEIKFYLDGDKEFPTICGTGTEDYFGGSWNFDVNDKYQTFTTPYSGMTKVIPADEIYKEGQKFSLYRWHITDPVYFKEDIKVTIQALGWTEDGKKFKPFEDEISSVAYWYQKEA